jgi:hypothetical protein
MSSRRRSTPVLTLGLVRVRRARRPGHRVFGRSWPHTALRRARSAKRGVAGELGDDDHRPGLPPGQAAGTLENAQARVAGTARPYAIGRRVPQHTHRGAGVLARGADGHEQQRQQRQGQRSHVSSTLWRARRFPAVSTARQRSRSPRSGSPARGAHPPDSPVQARDPLSEPVAAWKRSGPRWSRCSSRPRPTSWPSTRFPPASAKEAGRVR